MHNEKRYTLFAGVNGAGKSTFFKSLSLASTSVDLGVRVNTDEIVREQLGGDWKDKKAQMMAGRIAIKTIKNCLNNGLSLNQETTLSGRTIITTIKNAKANGFSIELYYVGLESAQLSIDRVASRVLKGGHGIPEEDILRRYDKSFEHLKIILPLCDKVLVYDNSKEGSFDNSKPLLMVKDGIIRFWDENCPQYMKTALENYITDLQAR